ncbi:hypothetical protein BSKO_07734 [Bryopsis sp. KO-2023]|nr:hypothetical protein BSKO_07734 [Bryopsis sp. KO-2023]
MGLDQTAVPRVSGGVSRFLAGFYTSNFLLLASYALTRQYYISYGQQKYSRLMAVEELFAWEKQAWGMFAVAMVVKYVRSQSLDDFLSSMFLYGKAVVALLSWMFDVRIFAYYIMLYIILFMMFSQPVYEGPDKIDFLTPASLRDTVLGEKGKGMTYLVEFYAHWSPACVHLEPVFAELSLRYATETLRFAKFDLARWPHVAKDHFINMAGASPQLPTLIMFEDGKEIARIPHVFSDGSVAKGRYRKGDIVKGFELDMRYTRTKGQKGPQQSGQDKKKD